MNYDLNEGLLQSNIRLTVYDLGRVYNIDYALTFPNELTRFYYYDKDKLVVNLKVVNDVTISEGISYICNVLSIIGIDPLVNLKANETLKNYLDYLGLDVMFKSSKNVSFVITDEESELVTGKVDDGYLKMVMDIENVRGLLKPSSKDIPDVCIYGKSEEEKLKASIIMQDLRLNNVVCIYKDNLDKLGDYDVKHVIILNDKDLNKGLITVKDHLTKDEKKVPEDEIVDYILGII